MKTGPMNFMMTFLPPWQEIVTSNSDTWTPNLSHHHLHLIMNPPSSRQLFKVNSSTQQQQSPRLPWTTSRREPRGMPQSIPYSRMTSTMIHFRGHSWQISRHKASMMLLTLIMILRVVTSMNKNFSRGNSPLYILFWLLPYKQKRGEN